MIISQIVGGLGNQLFQYASARQLSLLLDQEIYLDLNFFDTYHDPDVFRLDKYKVHYKIANQEDIDRLKEDFDFVVLATGSQNPILLTVSGGEKMIPASDFLAQAKKNMAAYLIHLSNA